MPRYNDYRTIDGYTGWEDREPSQKERDDDYVDDRVDAILRDPSEVAMRLEAHGVAEEYGRLVAYVCRHYMDLLPTDEAMREAFIGLAEQAVGRLGEDIAASVHDDLDRAAQNEMELGE